MNSIPERTPYERWHGKKIFPTCIHLAPEFCALDKTANKGKFEHRGVEGIFVVYASEAKAYLIWFPKEQKTVVLNPIKFLNECSTVGTYQKFYDEETNTSEPKEDNVKDTLGEKGAGPSWIGIQMLRWQVLRFELT